jgi:tryptophan-rich sensory protein
MIVKSEWVALLLFVVACLAVAGLGSIATTPEIQGWYGVLRKPRWTPPNWLFGPVWTALYVSMAIAAWLVWRERDSHSVTVGLWLFAIQLGLNLAWSFIFFKFHSPGWAFAEIAMLWAAIAATIMTFGRISKVSAALLVPYLIWVTYAAGLNYAIWRLNR